MQGSVQVSGVGKNSRSWVSGWDGAEGEEAQVVGAFMRNNSDHSDLASGLARNEVGEP
jgi:hypothetical protein